MESITNNEKGKVGTLDTRMERLKEYGKKGSFVVWVVCMEKKQLEVRKKRNNSIQSEEDWQICGNKSVDCNE